MLETLYAASNCSSVLGVRLRGGFDRVIRGGQRVARAGDGFRRWRSSRRGTAKGTAVSSSLEQPSAALLAGSTPQQPGA